MTAPEQFRRRLLALGFDAVRFARVDAPEAGGLRPWLEAGMQADMGWMERSAAKRLDPQLVVPGARSIVMLGINYWRPGAGVGRVTEPPRPGPAWARYALYQDYHDTVKPGLVAAGRALEEMFGAAPSDYRYYVDTGPVLERAWATRAGLGFTGKNAMLISREFGNWLLLAALLTRVAFAPDPPVARAEPKPVVGRLCGKCTRCLDACPTGAFPAPGVVDARRCISYQTIENKGVIPRELRPGIGHRIYGCDVCLEVCPWNRFARAGRQVLLASRHDVAQLTLAELLALTPERFAAVFRGTPIKRLKLAGLLRNACVVAGNAGDTSVVPQLIQLAAAHASPLVRAHAVWAVRRLGAGDALAATRAQEADATVLAEYEG
ncbi:MAG TPA: tRNA epoxyqueuosine(34) reductase QueG [Dehalococcoidia bacterium]|nr:tRNA epoxyqueuosine(34) reductase QueG [Dehalococcoidia bacterium]